MELEPRMFTIPPQADFHSFLLRREGPTWALSALSRRPEAEEAGHYTNETYDALSLTECADVILATLYGSG